MCVYVRDYYELRLEKIWLCNLKTVRACASSSSKRSVVLKLYFEIPIKRKIHTFLKCIYYRAHSMVGIIIHLMCVKSLQYACSGHWGSGHLQVNELLTSGLESL